MSRFLTFWTTANRPCRSFSMPRFAFPACSLIILLWADMPGSGTFADADELFVLRSSPTRQILYTSAIPPAPLATGVVGYQAIGYRWNGQQWVPVFIEPPQAPAAAGPASGSASFSSGDGGYPQANLSAPTPPAPSKAMPAAVGSAGKTNAPSKSFPRATSPVPSKSMPATVPAGQSG